MSSTVKHQFYICSNLNTDQVVVCVFFRQCDFIEVSHTLCLQNESKPVQMMRQKSKFPFAFISEANCKVSNAEK